MFNILSPKHTPSTLPPSINAKKVSSSIDKVLFTQTCCMQSCVLVLLEVGWNLELVAAFRELTIELIRRSINSRKGN